MILFYYFFILNLGDFTDVKSRNKKEITIIYTNITPISCFLVQKKINILYGNDKKNKKINNGGNQKDHKINDNLYSDIKTSLLAIYTMRWYVHMSYKFIYICIYICKFVHTNIYLHVRIYVFRLKHLYLYIYILTQICMSICTYLYKYIYIPIYFPNILHIVIYISVCAYVFVYNCISR